MFLFGLFVSTVFAKEHTPFTFGYRINARPVFQHNPDFNAQTDDNTGLYMQNFRLITTGKWDGIKIRFSVQDTRIWGEDSSSIRSQQSAMAMHEGYFQLNTKNEDHWLRFGRQAYAFGKGSVLSKANWNPYGLAYDGVRFHSSFNNMTWDLLATQQVKLGSYETTCEQDCDDFVPKEVKSNGEQLWVLTNKTKVSPAIEIQPYGLMLLQSATEEDLQRDRRIYSPGLLLSGVSGQIKYFVEGLYQFGQQSADIDHQAWKAVADIGWSKDALGVGFRYEENSGDGDPDDQVNNNLEPFFPANHGHRGWADKVGSFNSRDLALRLHYRLNDQVVLKLHGHHFALSNVQGEWLRNNGTAYGVTPAGNTISSLGEEIDLEVAWSPRKGESFRLTHAHFVPTGVGKEIAGSDRSSTTYLWILVNK